MATALEGGDEARVERAAAALERALGDAGPADHDLSGARTWLEERSRTEEARQRPERKQPERRTGPARRLLPVPKRSPAGLLALLAIAVVVITVVLWAILERGPWSDAQEPTATAIPATLTATATTTERPTNTAVPEQGEVEIRSSVSGDVAWLDGERVGTTPKTVQVASGRHQVKVTRPGCEAAERWFDVVTGQRQRVELGPVCPTPTRASTATASPTSTPRPRQTPIPTRREAGTVWVDPGIGMRFRYIPAGTFEMGSPTGEADRDDDERQHKVKLSRGYWMGETEVTQGQWKALMGSNPSHFSSCGEACPVET
ncbi:MAG: PEGA domain-containing protein, partial [bacterium]|nr:PEGA domain-containing protein [bacterium]